MKLGHEASERTEEEFLRAYQARRYDRPSVTTDIVIFTLQDCLLRVLLIKRKGHPFQDHWAIPGGFLDVPSDNIREMARRLGLSLSSGTTEGWPPRIRALAATEDERDPVTWDADLRQCAERELEEETSLPRGSCFLEQLYTFGGVERDPRTYVVTTAFYALVPSNLMSLVKPRDDAKDARWFAVEELGHLPLAFDHKHILQVALQRLRGKIDYFASIAQGLLPPTFTESELRAVYETVKGTEFNRGTFSRRFRRMQEDGHITPAAGRRLTGGRPAAVYSFSN